MRIEPKVDIEVAFRRLYKEAFERVVVSERADPTRAKYLRCSSLPFCPFSLIFNLATNHQTRFLDFRGTYYTKVGTAVHEVMQTALMQVTTNTGLGIDEAVGAKTKMGMIVGDWVCPECGKEEKLTTQPFCCGFPMAYEEIKINYKGIRGHLDTLYLFQKFAVVDYKTTSLQNAESMSSNPPEGYVEQILSYAYLLRKQYRIKIEYVMLVFIPRDNPQVPYTWKRKVTRAEMEGIGLRLRRYKQLHRRTLTLTTELELLELLDEVGPCKNHFCITCNNSNMKEMILNTFRTNKQKFPLKKLL